MMSLGEGDSEVYAAQAKAESALTEAQVARLVRRVIKSMNAGYYARSK